MLPKHIMCVYTACIYVLFSYCRRGLHVPHSSMAVNADAAARSIANCWWRRHAIATAAMAIVKNLSRRSSISLFSSALILLLHLPMAHTLIPATAYACGASQLRCWQNKEFWKLSFVCLPVRSHCTWSFERACFQRLTVVDCFELHWCNGIGWKWKWKKMDFLWILNNFT